MTETSQFLINHGVPLVPGSETVGTFISRPLAKEGMRTATVEREYLIEYPEHTRYDRAQHARASREEWICLPASVLTIICSSIVL